MQGGLSETGLRSDCDFKCVSQPRLTVDALSVGKASVITLNSGVSTVAILDASVTVVI